jgi:methylated-DNA-protein-cysteine methyltransferase-like protein
VADRANTSKEWIFLHFRRIVIDFYRSSGYIDAAFKRVQIRMSSAFHQRIKEAIRQVPAGKVATYGQIAAAAGNPYGAREVVRVLHASSEKDNLPWHRIVNRFGRISLHRLQGYELQRALLEAEGVIFDESETIDLEIFCRYSAGGKRGQWMR